MQFLRLCTFCTEQRSGIASGICFPVPLSTAHHPWSRNPLGSHLGWVCTTPKGSRGVPVLIRACACNSTQLQAEFLPKTTNATEQMSQTPEKGPNINNQFGSHPWRSRNWCITPPGDSCSALAFPPPGDG